MAPALCLALLGALAWVWGFTGVQRQDKYIRTTLILMAGYAIFLLWMVFASGWRGRARWSVIGGTVAVALFCRFALRISGVTGDLLPIVEGRWTKARVEAAEGILTRAASPAALTASFPQFLGPSRNGVLAGPVLARDWTKAPPRVLWRHGVGAAWSGFAVEGARAVTQEQRDGEELAVCHDTLTGAVLWTRADVARYATVIAGEGPRATPTISSNRVFTMGGTGLLNCLDLATGKLLWQHDTLKESGAPLPEWGVACSPLVTERAVIVTVGGRHGMVAFDRETGARLWAAGSDSPHWCSPVRVTLGGLPQVVVFSENVSAYDEHSGKVLWQSPWRSPYPHVSTPLVVSSNRVLVSQGYGGGSELLEVAATNRHWRATRVWKSIRLKSKFANMIALEGFVYGLDDGALACVELATGELKWKGGRYGHGQMLLVGELLLLMAESGEVVLVEPGPAEPRELSRFKVFAAKTWNPPALAGDLLLIRNDREAACVRLPLAPGP